MKPERVITFDFVIKQNHVANVTVDSLYNNGREMMEKMYIDILSDIQQGMRLKAALLEIDYRITVIEGTRYDKKTHALGHSSVDGTV